MLVFWVVPKLAETELLEVELFEGIQYPGS